MKNTTLAKTLFILWNVALAFLLVMMAMSLFLVFKAALPFSTAMVFFFFTVICGVVSILIGLLDLYVVLHGFDFIIEIFEKKEAGG